MAARRDSKETDVYQPPARATTLQESGRRMPLRHSDTPDYDAVSVSEAPPRRRGLWLLIALLLLAALGVAAWRILFS
jgi:MYXO-CTERM domain-containing protein